MKIKTIHAFIFIFGLIYLIEGFKIFRVSSGSMIPTLRPNQLILSIKSNNVTNYKRNTLVVFEGIGKTNTIKRIVGIPNDTVFSYKNKIIIRNNAVQIIIPNTKYCSKRSFYTIPKNQYYVVGDNYSSSIDSRTYGTVNEKQIKFVVIKNEK